MSCWVCESWSSRGSTRLSAISRALVNDSLLSLSAAAVLVHQSDKSAHIPPKGNLKLTSFSGAASKTLKNRFPPGDTSSILAILPHLHVSLVQSGREKAYR